MKRYSRQTLADIPTYLAHIVTLQIWRKQNFGHKDVRMNIPREEKRLSFVEALNMAELSVPQIGGFCRT